MSIEINFILNGITKKMNCLLNQNMRDICNQFSLSEGINLNQLQFLYNGNQVNLDLKLDEQLNSFDKERKIMTVLVYELRKSFMNNNSINIFNTKEIICPKCFGSCRLKFKDFKINLFGCKNGHEINDILLPDFNKSQFIDESNIICEICKKINKKKSYNNQFYRCPNCNINLCPSCNSQHNKNHKTIDYDLRNLICNIHNECFIYYCQDCKYNLCKLCKNEHNNNHRILDYKNYIPEENAIKSELNEFKKKIDKFKNIIQNIVGIFNKIIENLDTFHKINFDIINNYNSNNKNYQILKNIEEINNNLKSNNIDEIINKNDIDYNQLKDIISLYYKMNTISKENNTQTKNIKNISNNENPSKTFSNIIELIDNSNNGDIIYLRGYYIGNGNPIKIKKEITIIGDDNTILDAKGKSLIFHISAPNVNISNLKLINGSNSWGGAIRWQGDNGLLSSCILENNNSNNAGYGGAVHWWASNGKIIQCTFKNNKANNYGGAIYINGKGLKVLESNFENNSVINSYSRWQGGGAIYSDSENHLIEDCIFVGNSAPKSWGGAIKWGSGTLSVKRNTFAKNLALRGNNIFAGKFSTFNDNVFYIENISEIKNSAQDDDVLNLFDKNNFIMNGNIISKNIYLNN